MLIFFYSCCAITFLLSHIICFAHTKYFFHLVFPHLPLFEPPRRDGPRHPPGPFQRPPGGEVPPRQAAAEPGPVAVGGQPGGQPAGGKVVET